MTYTYDGDGNRVQKSNGKLYWFCSGSVILDESDAAGNVTGEYVFFGGKRLARRVVSSGQIQYYFADHLGSSRVVTDASGNILDDADFYPFGGERTYTSTSGNAYKFTSKERDAESGLDDFGARYFTSQFGRFMTPDWSASPVLVPYADLGNPQTFNLYSYVANNPLNGVDPEGHLRLDIGPSRARYHDPDYGDPMYGDPVTPEQAQNTATQQQQPSQPQTAQNQSGLTVSVVSGQKDAAGTPYAEAAAGFTVSIQSKTNFAPGDLTVTADLHFDADKKVAKGTEVLLGAAAESAQAKVGGQEAPKTVNSLLVDVRPYNKPGSFGGKPQEGGYIRFTATDSQGHKQTGTLNVQVISKRMPGGYSLPAGAWVQRLVVPIPNP